MEIKAEVEEGRVKEESALQALAQIYEYSQQRRRNKCETSCVFYRMENRCILYMRENMRKRFPREVDADILTDEDAFEASVILCQWCKEHEGLCESTCALAKKNTNGTDIGGICPFRISVDVRDAILARGLIKKKARAKKEDNRSALRRILGTSKGDKSV